jgi:hypothetical protein
MAILNCQAHFRGLGMKKRLSTIALLTMMLLNPAYALGQAPARPDAKARGSRGGDSNLKSPESPSTAGIITPMAAAPLVNGTGSIGRLTRWKSFSGGIFTIGDSVIAETQSGNIGIGTLSPQSRLTVEGMIQTTLGGLKFPDGTIQTTAAAGGLASIFRDATLTGNGTTGLPLGIANGGVGTNRLADNAVTAIKIAPGAVGALQLADGSVTGAKIAGATVVRSFNGLSDGVTLAAGNNVTITPSGNTLTIAATGLGSITKDATLTGDGSAGAPLGIALPINLVKSVAFPNSIVNITNSDSGAAIIAESRLIALVGNGSPNSSSIAGTGVSGTGGASEFIAGAGVIGNGGASVAGFSRAGTGVLAIGGRHTQGVGGPGIEAFGGLGPTLLGGVGLQANGGFSEHGSGGTGAFIAGGTGNGAGKQGGDGIFVFAGLGANGATSGRAGIFQGNVEVTGTLSKGGGSFRIDHPLDPENKYLSHSFVESPDMKNIYDGVALLDSNGEAVVVLPEWFEALNRDFRYLLTSIGAPAPGLYIAEKINDNRFKIAGGQAGLEVSWQVTGIRRDAWADKYRIKVEEEKPERDRGFYLHPELFNQSEEKSVEWARSPEMMKQVKESINTAKEKPLQQKRIQH